MKIFIDTNKGINVREERAIPTLVGNNYVDKIEVYYNSNPATGKFYPSLNILKSNGRRLSDIGFDTANPTYPRTFIDDDNVTWYYFAFTLSSERGQLDVTGQYQISITTNFYDDNNTITAQRNINTILNVKNAVKSSNGKVLIFSDNPADDVIDVKNEINNLKTSSANLSANKADKDNNQQVITAATVNAGSFKKDNVELATTAEVTNAVNVEKAAREAAVSAEETARQEAVSTEKSQRESADSALQTAINAKVSISDIINALNDTSTTKPLSAYQGKLLKDAIDAINSLLQSNDTDLDTLQELVTYIKNNKSLIDAITINKISVSAIIDNLTSAITNQPLSAKQGKVLKDLIDTLTTTVNSLLTNISYDTTNKRLVVTVNGQTQEVVKTSKLRDDMNLNKTDVGLGNVTNDKQVRGLASGTTENDIVLFGLDGYSVKNSGKKFITQVRDVSNANDSSIPTEKSVRTELDTKQDSAYTLTVNNVEYSNIEAILSALNTFVNLINSEVGAITGEGDTTLASEFAALKAAWEAFMAGTDADDITDTLLSVQQNIASLQSAIADLNTEVLSNAVTISGCTQNIPTGARGYAKITKIGSIQWFEKQLINNSSLVGTDATSNGITFNVASASPYTITAIGTATADVDFTISQEITFEKGHRYYVSGLTQLEGVTYGIDYLEDSNSGNFKFTATETFAGYLKVYIADETVIQLNDLSFTPQIWDLSLMGIFDGTNASIEAELVKRGVKLTGYNNYGILYTNATTTFAKSYDSNGNQIQSLSILIDNFGLTLSNFNEACFSYYDLVNGKKVIKCAGLNLTGIEYEYVTTENGGYWRSTGNLSELNSNPAVKPLADSDTRPNAECSNYVVVSPNDVIANTVLNSISFDPTGEYILIYNGSSTTEPEAPSTFKYEMATPIETAVDGLEVKEIDFVEGGYIRATAMTGSQFMPLEVVYHVGLRDIVTVNTENDKKQQAEIDEIKGRLQNYEDEMDFLSYISDYETVTGTSGTLTNRAYTDLSNYSFIVWKETSASTGIVLQPVSINNNASTGSKIFRAEIGTATLKTVITFIAFASNKNWTVTVTKADINKSLYHLGAFDTISGNTITRQTGYVDLGSLSWQTWGSGNYKYIATMPQFEKVSDDTIPNIVSNNNSYPVVKRNTWNSSSTVSSNSITVTSTTDDSYEIIIGSTTISTVADLKAFISSNNWVIQYKLATSYTEQVIEGESILPLDSNMAQMIRQDVVEGLNLLDNSLFVDNKGISAYGIVISASGYKATEEYIPIKPNTKYSITNGTVYGYKSDKTFDSFIYNNTFITKSSMAYIRVESSIGRDVMLVESSHPYPYEQYHASKHITDEEATLLKEEEEKCSQLWDEEWENKVFATQGDFSSNNDCVCSKNFIAVKPNSIYKLSAPKGQFRVAYYTINQVFIDTMTGHQNEVFSITTPSNCYYIKFCSLPDITPYYGGTYTNDIMLNEGSEAKPYQEWNGEIVHEKRVPKAPTTAGTYKLQCVVDSNGNPTFSWVADN